MTSIHFWLFFFHPPHQFSENCLSVQRLRLYFGRYRVWVSVGSKQVSFYCIIIHMWIESYINVQFHTIRESFFWVGVIYFAQLSGKIQLLCKIGILSMRNSKIRLEKILYLKLIFYFFLKRLSPYQWVMWCSSVLSNLT